MTMKEVDQVEENHESPRSSSRRESELARQKKAFALYERVLLALSITLYVMTVWHL